MKTIDFLAIGDVVIDAFIKLSDAHTHHMKNELAEELCLRFGDKVPYEDVKVIYAVGNSPNAAVAASRLGLNSALSVVVGNDENGKGCVSALEGNGVMTELVETDPSLPTNYHYVLWYGVERTILVKHAPFVRHMPVLENSPKWIYLSSLGENTEAFHHEIAEWLRAHPETKLAFQPGTFQIKLGLEKIKDIYEMSEIFFCNVEEAERILGITDGEPAKSEAGKKKLMDKLAELGPKIIIMTDGIDGAYARDKDGTYWFMPVYPHTPIERTGAGDAFSSTLTSCLAMGKTLEEALLWAPINAMSVTQGIGAQEGLLTQEKIEGYLAKAPVNYKPVQI